MLTRIPYKANSARIESVTHLQQTGLWGRVSKAVFLYVGREAAPRAVDRVPGYKIAQQNVEIVPALRGGTNQLPVSQFI